jgi:type IV pilus assembly protein PilY1
VKTIAQMLVAGSVLAFGLTASRSVAEDIDIYAGGGSAQNPNVLFVIDNSSNWAAANQGWPDGLKQGQSELNSLRLLVDQLDESVNVGLMMFTEGSGSNRDGGYIRFAVRPMNPTNKAALQQLIGTGTCSNSNNTLNGTPNCIYKNYNEPSEKVGTSKTNYSAALFEAFKYFGGYTSPARANDNVAGTPTGATAFGPARYGGNPDAKSDPFAYSTDAAKATMMFPYRNANGSTDGVSSCAKNYIIFIGNGYPNSDAPASLLSGVGGDTTFLPLANFVWDSLETTSACYATCDAARDARAPSNIYNGISYTTIACGSAVTTGCAAGTAKYPLSGQRPTGTFTTPTTSSNNYADEWARFLLQTDVSSAVGQQNIRTYTIDVYKDSQDTAQTRLLMSMAKAGGGQYYAASSESAILKAMQRAVSEIQSVNSVFASSSLPVSVNTQGTYLNQVFIGMFRPDAGARPRWAGNVKQYQFAFINGDFQLADRNKKSAISATTGFITPCANSYWSSDTGPYWNFGVMTALAKGSCAAQASDFFSQPYWSDLPDGDAVDKGAAAQKLRGTTGRSTAPFYNTTTNYASRSLRTCNGSSNTSCTTLTSFDTSNAAVTASLSTNLINWVRGQDIDDEQQDGVVNEVRPSVHGDVVHSQPAVIDYGGATGVVAFYGDNGGVFRAVAGAQTSSAGNELWGFIAPETFSRLSRLRDNSPLVKMPGVSDAAATAKDYFFDGSIGVFQRVVSGTNTVWIYPTMRRGGRAIYAFDVSTPSSPSLKWRRGCFSNSTASDTACYDSNWSTIGQTWSKPQVGFLSGYVDASNRPKPVLVFGGGYDTCEDANSQTRCTSTPRKGANIWFVDADTAAIIRIYPTYYSVPGDVTLVKDVSGYVKYVYAGDTGGYLYRINVGSYNGSTFGTFGAISWTSNSSAANITIANLSQTNHARKFLFGPDVVEYEGFNAVLIGSGDRERPLETNYPCNSYTNTAGSFVRNQFYMVKDSPTSYRATPVTPADLTDVTTDIAAAINANGWLFSLDQCEQVVNKPLTVGGVTTFGTHQPSSSSAATCSNGLGTARGYSVDFLNGSSVSNSGHRSRVFVGGGFPPSPVGGIVDVDGKRIPFIIGGSAPSALEGGRVTINPSSSRYRNHWYVEVD